MMEKSFFKPFSEANYFKELNCAEQSTIRDPFNALIFALDVAFSFCPRVNF